MSKTKEQIIDNMGLDDPDGEIEDVMTTWHEQELAIYKEKLKAELIAKIKEVKDNPTDSEAADSGYITGLLEVKRLIS